VRALTAAGARNGNTVRDTGPPTLAQDVGGAALAGAQVTLAWTLILAGEGHSGYPLLLHWSGQAPSGLPGPGTGINLGQLACWVEDYGTARRELEGSIALARAQGSVSELPHALSVMAEVEFRHGEWIVARRLADEALQLATDIGQDYHGAHIQLAQLAAVTGDIDGVRTHVDAILKLARRTGSRALDSTRPRPSACSSSGSTLPVAPRSISNVSKPSSSKLGSGSPASCSGGQTS
jgi:hypothetical protein